MLCNLLHSNRTKRTGADQKRDRSDSDTLPRECLNQLWCKVEAGRGCRNGSFMLCVYRLVPLAIYEIKGLGETSNEE